MDTQQVRSFLQGGGQMGERIRAFDWSAHPFGPIETWPMVLLGALSLCLKSSFPTSIYWGPDLRLLYNDAWTPVPADRHPWALGRPGKEVWSDIWEIVGPQLENVVASAEGFSVFDQMLPMQRAGARHETYWNYSFTPILDPAGKVVGVFNQGHETTASITASKERAAESERLQDIFAQAPGAIAVLRGPLHRFEIANDAFIHLIGGRRDLIGRPAAEAIPEVAPQGFIDILDRVYRTGEPYIATEAPVVLERSGARETRILDFVFQPTRESAGAVNGIFFQALDKTERASAQQELEHVEERYRALFNAIDEGFCVIEFFDGPHGPLSDYIHIEANDAYAANAGIPNVVGQKVREMVPDEAEEWVQRYKSVLETGEPIRFEKELEKTGRWLELAAFRVEPASRKQVAVLFKDNSARRAAEKALNELNASLEVRVAEALAERKLLADIVQSADAFVQVADNDLTWLAVNKALADEFERIYGTRPKVGERMMDALAHLPDQAVAVEAIWRRALRDAPFIEVQAFGDPGRDRRFYEMRYYPLEDSAGERVGAFQIAYDVTDRLNEQAQLRKIEDALRQSQKMEAIGQLTGGIAHDFNNMLAVVIGALNLMQRRLDRGELDVSRYVDAAMDGAKRASTLTQRLLAFSRQQPLEPHVLDVNKLVASMTELLARTLGEHVQVETVLSPGLWRCFVDPIQLESAILNLSVNARDSMPDGGRLTIEANNASVDAEVARDYDVPEGQYVMIAVSDTGSGMTPETMAQAFEPFFTTKAVGKGTGLGLSQVFGFVRQSGGHVKLYSEVGIGTTVKLYLPRRFGSDAEAEKAPVIERVAEGALSETILVVEDEERVRNYSIEALKELGYNVVAADGPLEALRLIEQGLSIDLLFTDIVMPEMNGRRLADLAMQKIPGLKVLFTTGYTKNAIVHNGMLDPGTAILQKPFTIEQLAGKIRTILDS